jgi:exonuclease SbcC
MSYADVRLDLSSFNIACLVGSNGSGKSALLDAITWALWEAARSSSDELIRLGQNEMWVDISFFHNHDLYRVRRSRLKSQGKLGGKTMSKGTLDFQVLNDNKKDNNGNGSHGGSWVALTAASMRETQSRITDLLAMDYDTFINSVYIKQGRSDEFTVRAPGERKQVLADILGLSYFDRIQELAKDEAKQAKFELEHLNSTIEQQQGCEESLSETETNLLAKQTELKSLEEQIKDCENDIKTYNSKINALKAQSTQKESMLSRIAEMESDIEILSNQKIEQSNKVHSLQFILEQKDDLQAKGIRFDSLKEQVEKLDSLGLEVHDLETKQNELKSQIFNSQSRIELEVDANRIQLNQMLTSQSQLKQATTNIQHLEKEYNDFKDLLKKEADLSKCQEMHVQLSERAQKLQAEIDENRVRMEVELVQKQKRLTELEELLISRDKLENEKEALQKQSEHLDKLEVEFELVESKGLKLKSDIDRIILEKQELERRKQENKQKIEQLMHVSELSTCPLCASPIVDKKAVIEDYNNHNCNIDKEINEHDQLITALTDKRDQLRKEYTDLREQLEKRSLLDTNIGKFNEKLEAIHHAQDHLNQIKDDIKTIKENLSVHNYAQVERESLINIKTEIHKLDFDPVVFSSLQAQIRSKRYIESKYQQMKRELIQLDDMNLQIPALENKISQLTKQLQDHSYAHDLQEELKEIEAKIAICKYDRHEHHQLRQELAQLIPIAEQIHDLRKAESELPNIMAQLSLLETKMETKIQECEKLREELTLTSTMVEEIPQYEQSLSQLEGKLENICRLKDESFEKVAVLKSQLIQYKKEKEILDNHRQRLVGLQSELEDYNDLVLAFGKKGIQAIIIENALPEIENEANYILAKLSDNQMHLGLITQQYTRSGNSLETLDILIADNLGTRNYELFSGGEAFKINFALRIALSSMLARRSGTKLETLIIDEGFGSQDEFSRIRLIQAINAIAGDYARILVVTHISEIKEMFPVQVSITKEDGVSELHVLSL